MPPVVYLLCAALAFAGCQRPAPVGWQGYLEAELIYVAAPLSGRLEKLAVNRGDTLSAGANLFTLESAQERAAALETTHRLHAAQARVEDLKKGYRPSELAALEARLAQARASAELAQRVLDRQLILSQRGVIAINDLDHAQLSHERNLRAVEEIIAQISTAQLGGRADAVAAANAEVAAAQAANDRMAWAVTQKNPTAAVAASVYETLFRPGEFVAAGAPVVVLLPPQNLKVRFFVPEGELATLHLGDHLRVTLTSRPAPLDATINYISPRPEYTPPVLYNRDNRAKLVFLVEAAITIKPTATEALHPGQPVDVVLLK